MVVPATTVVVSDDVALVVLLVIVAVAVVAAVLLPSVVVIGCEPGVTERARRDRMSSLSTGSPSNDNALNVISFGTCV